MIHRILNRFFTFDYYIDQQGIIKRYLVEKENWLLHLANCKEYILKSIPDSQKFTIAVLGSGWLLDVPILELLKSNQLTLIDIHHPKQIKHKFKNQNNISFIEKDLTFGLILKARQSKSLNEFFGFVNITEPSRELLKYDYVISINILNQLDIILLDFLKMKFKIDENQQHLIRKKIQDNHLNSLPKGKSILISDWVELNFNDSNLIVNQKPLIYTNLADENKFEEWIWKFDTKKTYRKDTYTSFIVRATSI